MKFVLFFMSLLLIPAVGLSEELIFRGKAISNIPFEEKEVDVKYLEVLGLTLWDTDIPDVKRLLGYAPLVEGVGDAGRGQMCYEGKNSIVAFEFTFQQEPPRNLQEIYLYYKKDIPEVVARCNPSPLIDSDLGFAGGIRLGMNKAEIKKIWGPPGKDTGKRMIYYIRRIEKKHFTDDVSLYLEFVNNKLTLAILSRTVID